MSAEFNLKYPPCSIPGTDSLDRIIAVFRDDSVLELWATGRHANLEDWLIEVQYAIAHKGARLIDEFGDSITVEGIRDRCAWKKIVIKRRLGFSSRKRKP